MEPPKLHKLNAREWWVSLTESKQQWLANQYYPDDDFMVTYKNDFRIEKIWKKEYKP